MFYFLFVAGGFLPHTRIALTTYTQYISLHPFWPLSVSDAQDKCPFIVELFDFLLNCVLFVFFSFKNYHVPIRLLFSPLLLIFMYLTHNEGVLFILDDGG